MADQVDMSQKDEKVECEESLYETLTTPPLSCDVAPEMVDGIPHCRRCGRVIPEARIEAVPCTGLCAPCAELLENEEEPEGEWKN